MNSKKTTRFARAAATTIMGYALTSVAFAETDVPHQSSEANTQLISQLSSIQKIIQDDSKGSSHWKLQVAAKVRKHLEAHEPNLVPDYDQMVLELAADPSFAKIMDRLSSEYNKATPEMRERFIALTETLVSEMLPDIKDQIGKTATGISTRLETSAPDLAPAYNQMLLECAAEPGLEKLFGRLCQEWSTASRDSRQRIVNELGLVVSDLAPELTKGAEMASSGYRKHLDRHAPDLSGGFDQILNELAAEPTVEDAAAYLLDFWEQASPELRTRILGLVADVVADLIPDMDAHAGQAIGVIRTKMDARAPELVPIYNELLNEITSKPALENFVNQAGKQYKDASPEAQRDVIELANKLLIDLLKAVTKD